MDSFYDSGRGKSTRESPAASPSARSASRSALGSTVATKPPTTTRQGGGRGEDERGFFLQRQGLVDSGIGSRHGTSASAASPLARNGAGARTTELQNEQLWRERVLALREQCRASLAELSDSGHNSTTSSLMMDDRHGRYAADGAASTDAGSVMDRHNDDADGNNVSNSTSTSTSTSTAGPTYAEHGGRDVSLDNILGLQDMNFERRRVRSSARSARGVGVGAAANAGAGSAVNVISSWNARTGPPDGSTTLASASHAHAHAHRSSASVSSEPRGTVPTPKPRTATASDARWEPAVAAGRRSTSPRYGSAADIAGGGAGVGAADGDGGGGDGGGGLGLADAVEARSRSHGAYSYDSYDAYGTSESQWDGVQRHQHRTDNPAEQRNHGGSNRATNSMRGGDRREAGDPSPPVSVVSVAAGYASASAASSASSASSAASELGSFEREGGGGVGVEDEIGGAEEGRHSNRLQQQHEYPHTRLDHHHQRRRGSGTYSPALSTTTDDSEQTTTSYGTTATAASSSASSISSALSIKAAGSDRSSNANAYATYTANATEAKDSSRSRSRSHRHAGYMSSSSRARFQGATGRGHAAADAAIAIANKTDVHLADRSKQVGDVGRNPSLSNQESAREH